MSNKLYREYMQSIEKIKEDNEPKVPRLTLELEVGNLRKDIKILMKRLEFEQECNWNDDMRAALTATMATVASDYSLVDRVERAFSAANECARLRAERVKDEVK